MSSKRNRRFSNNSATNMGVQPELRVLLLEEIIERGARVVGGAGRRYGDGGRMIVGRRGIARYGNARLEEFALVGLILHGDSRRNRLKALKARGRLEMCALLAAMEGSSAFRAVSLPVDIGRKRGRATKTPGGDNVLEQARQPWASDV